MKVGLFLDGLPPSLRAKHYGHVYVDWPGIAEFQADDLVTVTGNDPEHVYDVCLWLRKYRGASVQVPMWLCPLMDDAVAEDLDAMGVRVITPERMTWHKVVGLNRGGGKEPY